VDSKLAVTGKDLKLNVVRECRVNEWSMPNIDQPSMSTQPSIPPE